MNRAIIAILRGVRPDEATDIAQALVDSGITIIEVPLNSPDPYASIKTLLERFGDKALIGAGTVLNTDEVARLAALGAGLVVSPDVNPDVIRATKAAGMKSYPGAMTPTECFTALRAGADGLKLFPGEVISPVGIKALKAVMPSHVPLLAVGGVSAETLAQWHFAGASGFGIGSGLFVPGMRPEDVRDRAVKIVASYDAAISGK